MTNVIHIDFAKPRRKPVDPISESLAEFRIAALRSEKLKLAIDSNCDAQLEKVWALLDRVQRLLRNSNSQSTEDVSA